MKILYAIQGTGNGHLSRAIAVLPKLQNRAEVDVLVSGIQADIDFPFEVKHQFKGLSFIFGKKGNIDYWATFKKVNFFKTFKDIKNCPVVKYDLVINDFEPITAWACKLKGVPCVSLSHQGAFHSALVPRPKYRDFIFDLILKYYAPANKHYSFHFKKYDENIYSPIIRDNFRFADIKKLEHYTVYLPAYSDKRILDVLTNIPKIKWQVFSKHTQKNYSYKNVKINKINLSAFEKSLSSCTGVICGAGFETPSEALFLGKKLLVVPMKGQYEQQCNAESLKEMGVKVLKKINVKKIDKIKKWIKSNKHISVEYPDEIQGLVDQLLFENIQALNQNENQIELVSGV